MEDCQQFNYEDCYEMDKGVSVCRSCPCNGCHLDCKDCQVRLDRAEIGRRNDT